MKKVCVLLGIVLLVTMLGACKAAGNIQPSDTLRGPELQALAYSPSAQLEQKSTVEAEEVRQRETIPVSVPQPEKVDCDLTVEDSFTDNEILLILYPQWNRFDYTLEDFSEVGCIDIQTHGVPKHNDAPTRYIKLTLNEHSKQNVLDCVRILLEREDVYYAYPNCIVSFEEAFANEIITPIGE